MTTQVDILRIAQVLHKNNARILGLRVFVINEDFDSYLPYKIIPDLIPQDINNGA